MTRTVIERIQASQIEVKRRRLLLFKPDNRCWDWSIKVPSTNAKKNKDKKYWEKSRNGDTLGPAELTV